MEGEKSEEFPDFVIDIYSLDPDSGTYVISRDDIPSKIDDLDRQYLENGRQIDLEFAETTYLRKTRNSLEEEEELVFWTEEEEGQEDEVEGVTVRYGHSHSEKVPVEFREGDIFEAINLFMPTREAYLEALERTL